ncbi:MAG: hypothetical protein ACREBS_09215 [Nitrososphaerales archaeon]
MSTTFLPADGLCCGGSASDDINYSDNGNLWVLGADKNPGNAWASANSTGLTINIQTCADSSNLTNCGPLQEARAGESFNDISVYGDLGGVPSNATVFSIEASIPNHSYYQNCQQDVSSAGGPGCTYELLPYDSAAFALISGGSWVVVSFAEICNTPCNTNGLQMTAFTSGGGDSVFKTLATKYNPTYTPVHKLTIATDKKTFIDFYVDNVLLYSNSTMPTSLMGTGSQLELSMRTSINNETDSATFSNVTASSSSSVVVNGLPAGSAVVVNGTGGFSAIGNAPALSNGTATVNVSPEILNLAVSVELNGKFIATYSKQVDAGAVLKLITS